MDRRLPGAMVGAHSTPDPTACRSDGGILLYHAGGLGDFLLSLPAVFRLVAARSERPWAYWGPPDRLTLLSGFLPAPVELLRSGAGLWRDAPGGEALECLRRFEGVVAFGGRTPPPWTRLAPGALALASFSGEGEPARWVPLYQRDALDAAGVPRLQDPWLPDWRALLAPEGRPEWIVLHPGSGDRRKNLSPLAWAACLGELRRRCKAPVLLVLGPAEEERGGWEPLQGAVDQVRCCRSVRELLDALARALLYLGNDSGASHLSGALGVPSVVFFGPSDPRRWRPLGRAVRIVSTPLSCAPCTAGGPISCQDPRCLASVSGGELAEAALGLLEGR